MKTKIKSFWIYAKIIHDIILYSLAVFMIIVVSLFTYEKSLEFDDLILYYAVIPTQTQFKLDEEIEYYSFFDSYEPVDIVWSEQTHCKTPTHNSYSLIDTDETSDPAFYIERDYPNHIHNILMSISDSSHVTESTENILRHYAEDSDSVNPWRLNISAPADGSTCQTTHKIAVTTDLFKLEKTKIIISSEFVYGTLRW